MDERKRKLSSRYWAHKVKISKIEGARRQIDCAITLWFLDGDEVSIHTLAAAAHQVIHDLKTHNGGTTKLLYDSALVKDEHRKQWKKLLKDASNSFKHADKDPNPTGEIEFSPFGNLMFLVFTIMGLGDLGEKTSLPMNALVSWLAVNEPDLISVEFRKRLTERSGIEDFEDIKRFPKAEFFNCYMNISAGHP